MFWLCPVAQFVALFSLYHLYVDIMLRVPLQPPHRAAYSYLLTLYLAYLCSAGSPGSGSQAVVDDDYAY